MKIRSGGGGGAATPTSSASIPWAEDAQHDRQTEQMLQELLDNALDTCLNLVPKRKGDDEDDDETMSDSSVPPTSSSPIPWTETVAANIRVGGLRGTPAPVYRNLPTSPASQSSTDSGSHNKGSLFFPSATTMLSNDKENEETIAQHGPPIKTESPEPRPAEEQVMEDDQEWETMVGNTNDEDGSPPSPASLLRTQIQAELAKRLWPRLWAWVQQERDEYNSSRVKPGSATPVNNNEEEQGARPKSSKKAEKGANGVSLPPLMGSGLQLQPKTTKRKPRRRRQEAAKELLPPIDTPGAGSARPQSRRPPTTLLSSADSLQVQGQNYKVWRPCREAYFARRNRMLGKDNNDLTRPPP